MSEKLNIQSLIDLLAAKQGIKKKEAETFIREFFNLIEYSLEKDKYVKIKGLGTFKLIEIENRESVNVNTGERFEIQAYNKVSFTPDTVLKEQINKPFSHFETVILHEETVLDNEVEQEDEEENCMEEIEERLFSSTSEEVKTEESDVNLISALEPEGSIAVENISYPIEEKPKISEEPLEEKKQTEVIYTHENLSGPSIMNVESESLDKLSDSVPSQFKESKLSSFPSRSSRNFFIAIVALVIIVCASAVFFLYYPEMSDLKQVFYSANEKELEEEKKHSETLQILPDTFTVLKEENPDIAAEDTLMVETSPNVETVLSQHAVKEGSSTPVVKIEKKASMSFEPDSVSYRIVGIKTNHVLQEGETLVRLALRFYGDKALWPYIAKYNLDIVRNPDNVPVGANLKIPNLVKK